MIASRRFGIPAWSPDSQWIAIATFTVANAGYNVAKYLPYGPVRAVLPYLIRRAQENSAIAGQGGREVRFIRSELLRRKQARALGPGQPTA